MKTRILVLIALTFLVATLANAQTSKEITVFGQKIHYVEAGSGPTVILLHGLGGSTQAWQFNITALAEKYHVVVPDQIGFGKSDKPLVNYRIRTYVDFLDQFCKQLGIERASLVGNSMGGWIAAAFTAAFPDRVDRLVLVDAAGYAPPKDLDTRTFYGLNPTTREGMKVLVAKVFYSKAFQTDAAIEQAIAARLAAGDGYTINSITESIIRGEDYLDDTVKTIKRPTLIIWGRQDGLVPLAEGEHFNKDIAGSKLIVFDQCGHVPNFEKAGEFNAAVLKFLSEGAQ
ncbi:MAG TPA: alpha/beta hydrolase [Pyrinomonadaceae bacterium]|jgi:pimeloyl-ACP methyl ester carboxylesterase|nr:alpha/beta hydrolase [Pyrinomonadaceae bacterium]